MIKTEIKKTTGDDLTDGWAVKIGRHILDGHQAGNPAAYIRSVIQNEPSPRLRFLSQSGEHRPRPPDPGPPGAAPGPASPVPDPFVFGAAPPRRAPKLATAWADPHGPGYGQCPRCERWVSVNLGGGRILPHYGPADGQLCPGSHYRPAYPVPCIRCGNNTVALRTDGTCSTCRRNRRAPSLP